MSEKIKVAILAGGDNEERVISEKSAAVVHKWLPKEKYDSRIIDIFGAQWRDLETVRDLDKNDFSFELDGHRWRPDVVFCAIHGSPMENGTIQGYFEILGIPYTCCDGFVSGLTMNKFLTKQALKSRHIPMAEEIFLKKATYEAGFQIDEVLQKLGLPVFVKPNKHGSSFGVTKVKTAEELKTAIDFAFQFDDEVMIEAFMDGREFGNGVMTVDGEVVVFPVTEIIPENEFFDYEAKYEGKSKEVTPADITPEQQKQLRETTASIYRAMDLKGFVRIDYILTNGIFHLIEINTVPGLSEASIIPQQAIAYGWTLDIFFDKAVTEALGHA